MSEITRRGNYRFEIRSQCETVTFFREYTKEKAQERVSSLGVKDHQEHFKIVEVQTEGDPHHG